MDPGSPAILLVTKYGRKKDAQSVEVLAGSLLAFVDKKESKDKVEFVFEVLDLDKHIRVSCNAGEFRDILTVVKELLRPIPTCKERLEVFNDNDWLNDGSRLKEGDHVYVKLKGEQSELPGILKFKGSDVQDSKGIYFGVELKVIGE